MCEHDDHTLRREIAMAAKRSIDEFLCSTRGAAMFGSAARCEIANDVTLQVIVPDGNLYRTIALVPRFV